MNKIRVLLVDHDVNFLDAASRFLAEDGRVQVVGRARDGVEGVRLAAALAPDLVLMELAMPRMNGLEATLRIKAQPDSPRVFIVTDLYGPESWHLLDEAKANGYVCKSRFGDALRAEIDALHDGLVTCKAG